MLADLYETSEKRDVASKYYAQIVRDYPKSELIGDAKYKLKAFGVPIPQPDPNALAWMTANQNAPRPKTPLFKRPLDLLNGHPSDEIYAAAKVGMPTMTQEGEAPGTETLRGGPGAQLATGGPNIGGHSIVATITPGSDSGAVQGASVPEATTADAPAPAEGTAPAPATDAAKPAAAESSSAPAASAVAAGAPSGAAAMVANGGDAAAASDKPAAVVPEGEAPAADASSSDATKKDDAAKTDGKESTSKKKKGLKKLIPW
jgi:hypothetical protein